MSKVFHDTIAAEIRSINYSKSWFRRAAALIEQTDYENAEVLELGSGNGEFSEIMRDKFNMRVTCVDYVESSVLTSRSKGFESYQIDLDNTDFSNNLLIPKFEGRFDYVVMLEVIEHIFDINGILAYINSLLKPGGKLLITTPNVGFIGYRLAGLFNGNIPPVEGHHIRFFDDRRLREHLFFNGFDCDSILSKTSGEDYNLDRIFTPRSAVPRIIGRYFVSALRRPPVKWVIPKSVRYSNLALLSCKENSDPLPLSVEGCKKELINSDIKRKERIKTRLQNALDKGYLDEHPNFRNFSLRYLEDEKL